jgi:hypothetical protein
MVEQIVDHGIYHSICYLGVNGRISTNASMIIIIKEKVVVLQEFLIRWFLISNSARQRLYVL